MKTIQVLLLVFVVCAMVIVGSQIAWRIFNKPPLPPVPPELKDRNNPRNTKPSGSNSVSNDSEKNSSRKTETAKSDPVAPHLKVGQISFAEDADLKKGDFWLEQTFELTGEKSFDGNN